MQTYTAILLHLLWPLWYIQTYSAPWWAYMFLTGKQIPYLNLCALIQYCCWVCGVNSVGRAFALRAGNWYPGSFTSSAYFSLCMAKAPFTGIMCTIPLLLQCCLQCRNWLPKFQCKQVNRSYTCTTNATQDSSMMICLADTRLFIEYFQQEQLNQLIQQLNQLIQ